MPYFKNDYVGVIDMSGGITKEVSFDLEVFIKDGNSFFRMSSNSSHDDYFGSFIAPKGLERSPILCVR